MSLFVEAARRGPIPLRVVLHATLGCVLLGGCSTDRFSSFSLGSGYGEQQHAPQKSAAAYAAPAPAPANRPAQASTPVQLTSTGSNQAGYMQVSRVDLPPLQSKPQDGRVRTADGYGAYNQPPLPDGVYTGPRVYTPYDQAGPGAPPPPPPSYEDRGGPPQSFYRKPAGDPPPAYGAPPGVYEPEPDPATARGAYRQQPYGPRSGGDDPRSGPQGRIIVVRPGDTLYSLADRYGVSADALARANGLSSRYIRPGQELIVPFAGPAAYTPPQAEAPRVREAGPCAEPNCHIVRPGETIASIGRTYGTSEKALLEANALPSPRALKAGQALLIPGAGSRRGDREQVANAAPARPSEQLNPLVHPSQQAPAGQPQAAAPSAKFAGRLLPDTPTQTAPAQAPQPTAAAEPTCEAALANPLPRTGKTFRKPVEGMTIAQFGPQRDGTVNEGITISVPRGTPIKAAENGVVAYVGDELPGFGNLILIRHADEYVTAYAHADEIKVRKCEVVKRGQVIATAGATGDASQPQLHFEIRRNSKPVDPTPLLGS